MTDTQKRSLDGLEAGWVRRWQEEGTYAFDRSKERADVYAIDTPPPTVSGTLHMGNVYSFTHTDLVARYQRMRGRAVFYPMGWDENGLPTERRVQNVYGVRCARGGVDTPSPELLPACLARWRHPSAERYARMVRTTVPTPLSTRDVPLHAHHLADPAKGTGIAMVCTFGDLTDVTWWRELRLPARPVLGRDGRLLASPPAAITSRPGRIAYRQLAGDTAQAARKRIAAMLRASGDLLSGPDPVRHAVNFYEKGTQPLE